MNLLKRRLAQKLLRRCFNKREWVILHQDPEFKIAAANVGSVDDFERLARRGAIRLMEAEFPLDPANRPFARQNKPAI